MKSSVPVIICAILLLPAALGAQSHPRVGLFHGWSYTDNEFLFNGEAEFGEYYYGAAIGLLIEQPLGQGYYLTLQPYLSKLTNGDYYYYTVEGELGQHYESISINEVWIVELPLNLKKEFVFGKFRPYASGGVLLSLTTPPERLWFDPYPQSNGWDAREEYVKGMNFGFSMVAGVQYQSARVVGVFLEGAWLQLLSRTVDTSFLTLENNARYHIRAGLFFNLFSGVEE